MLVGSCEKKIDTVLEYYCKKGRGDEIKQILEDMPAAGTQQAFLYFTQAYINAKQLDKAESVLDMLEQRKLISRLPYELLINSLSKEKDWDAVLRVVKRMDNYGFIPDYESLMKMQGVHE